MPEWTWLEPQTTESENATMPRFYTPKEFRHELRIGHTKYHEDINKGLIPRPVSLGGRCKRHPAEDLDAVVERLKAERDRQYLAAAK